MAEPVKEAPGELALVRAFVNTLDVETGSDDLGTPEQLAGWLCERGLLDDSAGRPALSERERARAVAVREALREVLLSNNDGEAPGAAALATLDAAAKRAKARLTVAPDGAVRLLSDAGGVDGAMGRLLVIAYEAMATGTWSRLKACRNDLCRWAFYDQSRNHSRHWCSMDACGNRSKVQRYRAKQRG